MTPEASHHTQEAAFHKALIKAKGQFGPLQKTKTNPHFKSAYAGLDDIAAAVDDALAKNGFTVRHESRTSPEVGAYFLSILHHVDGWHVSTQSPMPTFDNPQKWGSWQTYAKRYGKAALLDLVADDDDDGNAAASTPGTGGTSRDSGSPAGGSGGDTPGGERVRVVLGKLKDQYGDGPPWEGDKARALKYVFGSSHIPTLKKRTEEQLNEAIRKNWDSVFDYVANNPEAPPAETGPGDAEVF
jgi:hypothetical protein